MPLWGKSAELRQVFHPSQTSSCRRWSQVLQPPKPQAPGTSLYPTLMMFYLIASGPASCQRESELAIAACGEFDRSTLLLPCGISLVGAWSPFICLTTRRHCRSTMILRLSLPRGNLCFPDLNPCLLCHSPRTTASLPNPSRIRAQFSPAADRTGFLPEHSHTGRP